MISNIIYVIATASLLTGSVFSFDKKTEDYFFVIGTSLFLLKALMNLITEIITIQNENKYRVYDTL